MIHFLYHHKIISERKIFRDEMKETIFLSQLQI